MKKILIILQISLLNYGLSWSAGLPKITIPAQVEVGESRFYLGAIGKITGLSEELLKQLNQTEIGLSPLPGKSRIITRGEIYEKLRNAGVDAGQFQVLIPEEIQITRKFQTWTVAQITRAIEQGFLPTLTWREVKLEKVDFSETLFLPLGKPSVQFNVAPRTNFAVPFYLGISIRVEGEEVRKLFLRTSLKIRGLVPVAINPITPKDELTTDNLQWEMRPLTSLIHMPVSDQKQLEGKRVRRTLLPGSIICQDMLFEAPAIKRGEEITLVYRNDRIQVSTLGRSLGSGIKGDQIKVQNLDSKKEVLAEIVDNRTARVSR
jgi:flagellar basal body P-ring formation protein FlgA